MRNGQGFWDRWEQYFSPQEFADFRAAQTRPLPKTIRVNTLRNSEDDFLRWVTGQHPDWQLCRHPFGDGIFSIERKQRTPPLGHTLGHTEGRFYIQEASSCLPPLVLQPHPGETVLDMAAAPGSKTTQMAALMRGSGLLVANEIVASRVKKLVFNLQRCGVPNAAVTNLDGKIFEHALPDFFNKILLDAPCTGEGTLRKDHDALKFWSLRKIAEAAYLQEQLLQSAWMALAPGGTLVYSTCTLAPEENERVVSRFLETHQQEAEIIDLSRLFPGAEQCPGLTEFAGETYFGLDKALRVWPQRFDSEGFFVAALQKRKDAKRTPRRHDHSKSERKEKLFFGKEREKLTTALTETFGLTIPKGFMTVKRVGERREDYWLMPDAGEKVLQELRVSRPGIRIAENYSDEIRLDHEFAVAFGQHATGTNVLEVSEADAERFFRKENLYPAAPEALPAGDIILRHAGIPIGLAKSMNGILKNNLPIHFSQ